MVKAPHLGGVPLRCKEGQPPFVIHSVDVLSQFSRIASGSGDGRLARMLPPKNGALKVPELRLVRSPVHRKRLAARFQGFWARFYPSMDYSLSAVFPFRKVCIFKSSSRR